MNGIQLKENLHRLIDNTENEALLAKYYELISKMCEQGSGDLWERLTKSEQEELIRIEEESRDPNNLTSHLKMKEKHAKWLWK